MKRLFDVIVSTAGVVVLSPLLIGVSLLIRFGDGGPAFYRGRRVGLHGSQFDMLKFRTMVVDADKMGASSTANDDRRLTTVGRWLRRYKLDEIPQLLNVIKGDMSLVGPRPQIPWVVEKYSEEERIALTVRPGITDPASIRFADEGEILRGHADPDAAYFELIHPEKMRLSIDYVKNRTFFRDVRVILATLGAAVGLGRVTAPSGQNRSL